jgi:hypothetical protein
MKRLIMMFFCIFLLVGSASGQPLTIEGLTLYGGNGDTFATWGGNGQIWNTFNDGIWVLGVSSAAGGPLLNAADTTISGLAFGNYYLYAEPTSLGNNPKLLVDLSDSTIVAAIFEVVGAPGSGEAWTWKEGDSAITLGWALGTANLVDPGQSMIPSGNNDYYLQVGIHAGVIPLPGAVWLLGSGLAGLAVFRRRFGLS